MLVKHFSPPSVASATGKESQHNISGLSSFFRNLQCLMSYQQMDTPQPFSPADMPAPLLSSTHYRHRTRISAATSLASASSTADATQQKQWNHCHCLQSVLFWTTAVNNLKVLFRTTQISPKLINSCYSKSNSKHEVLHHPTLNTLVPNKNKTY